MACASDQNRHRPQLLLGMYRIKPIYQGDLILEKPECVYKMKNLHSVEMEKEATQNSDLLADIEQRQQAILSRLNELKETLNQLAGRHGMSVQSSSTCLAPPIVRCTPTSVAESTVHIETVLGKGIVDIVMHADPNQPPLSLFVLYEIMKSKYQVLATSYVHSSVISVDKKLTTAFQNASASRRSQNQLALSFIWKKVDKDPELVVSPGQHIPIQGEANIARYLNRVMDPDFDNRDIVTATQVDEWLDIAQLQLIHGNSKERAAAVRSLNSRLGRNDWLVGSSLSLADIVTWSAVHQAQQADSAPANVKKWLKACAKDPNFKLAESLLP
ncbi:hypothetical protein CHS0354_006447 [Potamilus streckersoni]|uniref:Aminoacyl tRNA synthase complex-interacting multifunctional protein 2 n=1 Tax=Potamilus streckersoni TaxID=2493646 RepID=A0AAE0W973_9BIVA|nr:hypothetical protein CHS0354_006447 [Potamilus streckersoni]